MMTPVGMVAVAFNNSDPGRAALLRAIQEAESKDQELVVLHVVEDLNTESREQAAADSSAAIRAAGANPDKVRVLVGAEGPNPAGALIDLAIEVNADTLVVGGRRRSPVGKLLVGSTVQQILLEAPMPVLFVKAD